MDRVMEQNSKLQDLKETNKYFYRLTSPAPNQVGTDSRNHNKGTLKNGTPDGGLLSPTDPFHCKPESISKYVNKLNKAEEKALKDKKNAQKNNGEKSINTAESLFEQNRKNKIKHYK